MLAGNRNARDDDGEEGEKGEHIRKAEHIRARRAGDRQLLHAVVDAVPADRHRVKLILQLGVEQRGIFAVIGVGPLVVIAVLMEIFLRDKPVELGNIRVVFVEHDVERAVHPALEFNPVLVAVGLNLDFALDGRLDALGFALGHRQFDAGRVVL